MSTSFKALALLFALICLSRSHYDGAKCSHHKHQQENPPEFLDIEEDFSALEPGRNLQTITYNPIRIYADYENLANTSSDTYTAYVRDDLAPAVISWFQGALSVKYPVSGNLRLSVSTLCGYTTPAALKTGVAADYAIIFDSRVEDSNVVATSKYCYLASDSKRPLVATTSFNQVMFKEAKGNVILHEKNTYLLLHEMSHTLGFSSSLYKYFLDPVTGKTLTGHIKTMTIAGSNHTVVDVAPLTEKLRAFHGCSTIPGAIMEDDGGSGTDGSHFDKKFYLYDTMASGSASGKRHSELSLALLEGSGWYVVDYTFAEPYFYGQGAGCDFIFGTCNTTVAGFDEFCLGTTRGCSSQGHSGSRCSSDDKTDGCRYQLPYNDYHCESVDALGNARLPSVEIYGRGLGSKCFTGTLSTKSSTSLTSFCFNYTCVGSGLTTQLQVNLGKTVATCKKEGTLTVSGYYGNINCPDPLTFCSTIGRVYCPRNCMGRGTCVNNKCQCNAGFAGTDCALRA